MSCNSEKDKGSKFSFSFHVKDYQFLPENDSDDTDINNLAPVPVKVLQEYHKQTKKGSNERGRDNSSSVRSKDQQMMFSDRRRAEFLKSEQRIHSLDINEQGSLSAIAADNEGTSNKH